MLSFTADLKNYTARNQFFEGNGAILRMNFNVGKENRAKAKKSESRKEVL